MRLVAWWHNDFIIVRAMYVIKRYVIKRYCDANVLQTFRRRLHVFQLWQKLCNKLIKSIGDYTFLLGVRARSARSTRLQKNRCKTYISVKGKVTFCCDLTYNCPKNKNSLGFPSCHNTIQGRKKRFKGDKQGRCHDLRGGAKATLFRRWLIFSWGWGGGRQT